MGFAEDYRLPSKEEIEMLIFEAKKHFVAFFHRITNYDSFNSMHRTSLAPFSGVNKGSFKEEKGGEHHEINKVQGGQFALWDEETKCLGIFVYAPDQAVAVILAKTYIENVVFPKTFDSDVKLEITAIEANGDDPPSTLPAFTKLLKQMVEGKSPEKGKDSSHPRFKFPDEPPKS
jgi:hypothetical protein